MPPATPILYLSASPSPARPVAQRSAVPRIRIEYIVDHTGYGVCSVHGGCACGDMSTRSTRNCGSRFTSTVPTKLVDGTRLPSSRSARV